MTGLDFDSLDGRPFTAHTLAGATISSHLMRTGQNKLKDSDGLALVIYRRRNGEVQLNGSLFRDIRVSR